MKKLFVFAAFVMAGVVLTLTHCPTSNSIKERATPSAAEPSQSAIAFGVTAPPPSEPEPVVGKPSTDLRDQWLDTLYKSPSVADRLHAARQILARGNEAAFLDLATFVTAAEATGEDALVSLAQQVATILGEMAGDETKTIATELAYSPSALVAEAAVDAAVSAEPAPTPQSLEAGTLQNPANQIALDGYLQQLRDYDLISIQSSAGRK